MVLLAVITILVVFILTNYFFPKGHRHFYEATWDVGNMIKEFHGASPLNDYVRLHHIFNAEKYPQLEPFRLPPPANLEAAINITHPLEGKNPRVMEIRQRPKYASLARNTTDHVFGHDEEAVKKKGKKKDNMGCKVICADSPQHVNCYRVLKLFENGITAEVESGRKGTIRVRAPSHLNITDHIRSPKKDEEGIDKSELKIITVRGVYESWNIREEFSIHIQPLSSLQAEKRSGSRVNHYEYKKRKWKKQESKWDLEEAELCDILKNAIDMRKYFNLQPESF